MEEKIENVLIFGQSYVYNPTNDWYQCTVAYEEQQYPIKVIPPRSCRNYPITFLDPKIVFLAKTTNSSGQRMRHTTSTEKLVEQPLNLKIISNFRGTIDLGSEQPSITPVVSINGDTLLGWYAIEQHLFILKGKIIMKTHEIRLSIFGSNGVKYKNLTGKVRMTDGKINIEASLGKLQIMIVSNAEDKIQKQDDQTFSGQYMAFQDKDTSQQDLYLTMRASTDGFILADVTDGKNKYTLNGCKNSQYAFFINITNGDLSFYGEINGTESEINITGIWHEGPQTGTFAFFKQGL